MTTHIYPFSTDHKHPLHQPLWVELEKGDVAKDELKVGKPACIPYAAKDKLDSDSS